MRELLGSTKQLAKQLAALEKKWIAGLDRNEVAILGVLRPVQTESWSPPGFFEKSLRLQPWVFIRQNPKVPGGAKETLFPTLMAR